MPRRTYPRRPGDHEYTASRVLGRHSSVVGTPITLPIPIELIIEQTFEIEIIYEEIEEPRNTMILGALVPADRQIILNSRHESLFQEVIGPERFTLAHELAHWVYDVDNTNQLALRLNGQPIWQHCYDRKSPGLTESQKLREVNANKLAAHLLLPGELVRNADLDDVIRNPSQTAETWGVSRATLEIRLQELGITRDGNALQQPLMLV